jgi:hypothetical protein
MWPTRQNPVVKSGGNTVLVEEPKKPEVITDAAYELRVKALEGKLQAATDALAEANAKLEQVSQGQKENLIAEIVERSTYTTDELGAFPLDTLKAIRASFEKLSLKGAGIKPGNKAGDQKDDSGLTAGRWDPDKKEWVK